MVYQQQMYQDDVLQPEINGKSHMFDSIDTEATSGTVPPSICFLLFQ